MELGQVIESLYDSKINCDVSTFWDAGLLVRLGDQLNGFIAETVVYTSTDAAKWLDDTAR